MAKDKLVVFHIPKWYPNRYDSLLGIFVKRHILSTLPNCVPVVLYAMVSENSKHWYEIEHSNDEGIDTYKCYYRKRITGLSALDKLIKLFLYAWLVLKLYYKAKNEYGKPSVVHAHVLLRTAFVARLIQCVDRVPYIIMEHSSAFIVTGKNRFNKITLVLLRYVVRKAHGVITVSECLANGMRNNYGLFNSYYRVVYNSVDTKVFTEKEKIQEREIKRLLYVGEFDDRPKNITGLLEVIADLSEQRKDFHLDIVGYGRDEALIRKKAESIGILDKVVSFKGKLSAYDVANRMREADVLLMFSRFETLSCVTAESMCCGTPVISTAVGGIVEIVNSGNGILVPEGDKLAMRLAIEQFLDAPNKYDKHTISFSAQAKFSNQAVGTQLVSIYNEMTLC